jgi:asparagine synthase (glutamine-hydrolysing)
LLEVLNDPRRAGAARNASSYYQREYSTDLRGQGQATVGSGSLMCGIGGIVALSSAAPDRAELERMCSAMVYRGPDDEGLLIDGPVGLAMRRLSIIDVAGGHQPIFNEDDSVAVVFNGEIYNYRELRAMLSRGHRFHGVGHGRIAHLWEEVGIGFGQLRGMFACTIALRRVVLARDHVGIKPCYALAAVGWPGQGGSRLGG